VSKSDGRSKKSKRPRGHKVGSGAHRRHNRRLMRRRLEKVIRRIGKARESMDAGTVSEKESDARRTRVKKALDAIPAAILTTNRPKGRGTGKRVLQ